eukprot:3737928-Rhodomonas_salina.1
MMREGGQSAEAPAPFNPPPNPPPPPKQEQAQQKKEKKPPPAPPPPPPAAVAAPPAAPAEEEAKEGGEKGGTGLEGVLGKMGLGDVYPGLQVRCGLACQSCSRRVCGCSRRVREGWMRCDAAASGFGSVRSRCVSWCGAHR